MARADLKSEAGEEGENWVKSSSSLSGMRKKAGSRIGPTVEVEL